MENTRELILDMLMEILEKGSYSHLVIRSVLEKYNYSDGRDKAFVKRVTEGTLERLIQIDYCLNHFSSVPVPKMKPLIRNLMRMSAYQLLFMDKIPDSAVCNEAVKLAGKRGFRGLSGFVNGVLRTLARNRDTLPYPDEKEDEVKYLSVKYSMPECLIEMWANAYGKARMRQLLEEFLREKPLRVRLKEQITEEELKQWLLALEENAVRYEKHPYLPYAYELWNTESVKRLPGYEEGLFVVQDVSSMLAVEAAGIDEMKSDSAKAGFSGKILVMDVCAAPGGKSMHFAEKLGKRGKVISRDVFKYKVALMRDNIERTGYENIEVQEYDAGTKDESLLKKADIVLADVPCSGLGVMGKKPDIKYRISSEVITELEKLQKKILDVVWEYVKPGGILIYSTCTISPGENDKMVKWFVKKHPFTLESLSPYLPAVLKQEGEKGMLQLFPGIHRTDGFFIARLRRTAGE